MADKASRQRQGAAMAGSGAVIGGTGFIAGGIPGAKEPNALKVWQLKGVGRSRAAASNLAHNGKIIGPQPRAGILGFRANMHDAYIKDTEGVKARHAYERGNLAGKLQAEHQIVPKMRLARRAAHGLTFGGAALAVGGMHRMKDKKPVRKRDQRDRGPAAGAAGAAAGTVAGTKVGIQGGGHVGVRVANRKINAGLPKGMMAVGGDSFVQRKAAATRGIKGGLLVAVPAMATGGYKLARGKKPESGALIKRDNRKANASAAALGAGGTAAGVAHFVPKGLDKFERHYERSSKEHVRTAQRMAPHLGGLQMTPEKVNGFGVVTRRARETMKPEIPNWKIEQDPKLRNKIAPKYRAEVGRHRGIAANEKHFAEAFNGTSRVIRRFRGPSLAVAGAGATGLWASREPKKPTKIKKYDTAYGYQERRVSPLRATEAAVGVTLLGWGGSRLGMVKGAIAMGTRKPGTSQINWARAEKARAWTERTTGRGAAMLGRQMNTGFKLRPVEGAVGGAILTNHAVPIRRNQFTATAPTMQGGY